jgi:Iap family predicted aminopeptidase
VAATDGLIALRAGYPTCTLGGVDETKFPSNYHWPTDVPDNLTWESVEGAVKVCDAYVRATPAPSAPSAP